MKSYISWQIRKHWPKKDVEGGKNLDSVKTILSKKSWLRFLVGKKRLKFLIGKTKVGRKY